MSTPAEANVRRMRVRALVGTAILLAFAGLVIYDLESDSSFECDVCMRFKGETDCARGAGATEDDAVTSARTNLCARLASGVTESFACSATPTLSASCTP